MSSEGVPVLLTNVAPEGRICGTGELAGEVIVSEMSVSAGTASSRSAATTPRRQRAPGDGRGPRNFSYNVDFGVSPTAFLPPSTGSFRSINVERVEGRYTEIAASITDLAIQGLVCAVSAINDDIISAIKEQNVLTQNGLDSCLIDAYQTKIVDLEREKTHDQLLCDCMFANLQVLPRGAGTTTGDVGDISAMSVVTDNDGHRDTRRRRSAN